MTARRSRSSHVEPSRVSVTPSRSWCASSKPPSTRSPCGCCGTPTTRKTRRRRSSFGSSSATDLLDGLSDDGPADAELSLLTEDVKLGCTRAMLQCLDRPHRLAYALGEIFDLPAPEAADAMSLEPSAFRKRHPDAAALTWTPIPATKTGYVQRVDSDGLFEIARAQGDVLRMECGVGEFIVEGSPLASLSGGRRPARDVVEKTNAAYSVGRHRTVTQDAAYGVRQIVDVALKALSPGVNDTTTATTCVDYLGAILVHLTDRQIEAPDRSHDGRLRLIARGPTFDGLLREALEQIRQNAEGNVAVLVRLLQVLELSARRTRQDGRRAAIIQHVQWIVDSADRGVPAAHDRATVRAAAARVGAGGP
jgi:hypothetical protein